MRIPARNTFVFIVLLSGVYLSGCKSNRETPEEEADPPEIALGERLFLETRFAQFFAQQSGGEVNQGLVMGDPVVEETETLATPFPGPFAGQAINCAACHLVDQHVDTSGGGIRTYADFARRSPIPAREDGQFVAVRNSPALVNASLERTEGLALHLDGEFTTLQKLVEDTLTGRNYGWLVHERDQAIRHIAHVIREDDGSGDLAQEFGGAYRIVLSGTEPTIPPALRLPEAFRVDVTQASDLEIFQAVARLIAHYVDDLRFERDDTGSFIGSPFDHFLIANHLPRQPAANETPLAYNRRLRQALAGLDTVVFVQEADFTFHEQSFVFGQLELNGLRIFLAEPEAAALTAAELAQGGIGNCLACHPAPAFSDFRFHNTGTTEREYDSLHGNGSFATLAIPTMAQRQNDPDAFLPATARRPQAQGPFRALPALDRPGATDLGVWNIFVNPDFPDVQARLRSLLCRDRAGCTDDVLLQQAIAAFKTPGLRDLSHSAPYMHSGQFETLTSVVRFYQDVAAQARAATLRNADSELARIALSDHDIAALVAFLRALNEDYN